MPPRKYQTSPYLLLARPHVAEASFPEAGRLQRQLYQALEHPGRLSGVVLHPPCPSLTLQWLSCTHTHSIPKVVGNRAAPQSCQMPAGRVGKLRHSWWVTAGKGEGSNPASASSASLPPFLGGIDVLLPCTKWLVRGFAECKVMEREIQSQAQLRLCYRPIWKGKCSAFFSMPATI